MANEKIRLVNPVTSPSKTQIKQLVIELANVPSRLTGLLPGSENGDAINLSQLKTILNQLAETESDINNLQTLIQAVIDNLGLPEAIRKGDILVYDGTQWTVKHVTLDGYVLTVDSTKPDGLIWKKASSNSYFPQGW